MFATFSSTTFVFFSLVLHVKLQHLMIVFRSPSLFDKSKQLTTAHIFVLGLLSGKSGCLRIRNCQLLQTCATVCTMRMYVSTEIKCLYLHVSPICSGPIRIFIRSICCGCVSWSSCHQAAAAVRERERERERENVCECVCVCVCVCVPACLRACLSVCLCPCAKHCKIST